MTNAEINYNYEEILQDESEPYQKIIFERNKAQGKVNFLEEEKVRYSWKNPVDVTKAEEIDEQLKVEKEKLEEIKIKFQEIRKQELRNVWAKEENTTVENLEGTARDWNLNSIERMKTWALECKMSIKDLIKKMAEYEDFIYTQLGDDKWIPTKKGYYILTEKGWNEIHPSQRLGTTYSEYKQSLPSYMLGGVA